MAKEATKNYPNIESAVVHRHDGGLRQNNRGTDIGAGTKDVF